MWENLRETPGFLYKNELASSMTIVIQVWEGEKKEEKTWDALGSVYKLENGNWPSSAVTRP